jgi:DNA-binding protein HU-beta
MTKADLVNAIKTKGEYTSNKEAEKALATVTTAITEALAKGEKIQLIGFGTFEVRERAAKDSKNPRTGETIHCPAKKAPAFKAGKALKDAVNK